MRRLPRLTTYFPILLLLVLTGGVYWKLVFGGGRYVWFDHYDMCALEVPRLQFVARSLHEGRFPLWDPHIWGGLPVLGAMQPGVLYPLTLLMVLAAAPWGTVSAGLLNAWFVAMHFLGAYFCYRFCRELGVGRGAVLGGIAFSTLGFFGAIPWLDVAGGVVLTPLVALFALRLCRGGDRLRDAALAGLTLGIAFLSGHHEVPILLSYAFGFTLCGVFLARAWRGKRDWGLLRAMLLSFTLAGLVSAVQLFPAYEFGKNSKRWAGTGGPIGWETRVPYAAHAQNSLRWSDLAGVVAPDSTGESGTFAYLGLPVCLLAAIGMAAGRRDPAVRAVAVCGVLGLAFALGSHLPLHRLLYEALPLIEKTRNPARAMFLCGFAASVLAAYGVHAMCGEKAGGGRRWWGRLGSALLLAGVAIAGYGVAGARIRDLADPKAVCVPDLFRHPELGRELREMAGLGRVAADTSEILVAVGDLYGVDQYQSFVAGASAHVLRHEFHTARTRELFGVTHRISTREEAREDMPAGRLAGGIFAFRKARALPRAWAVHEVKTVKDEGELRDAIQDPGIGLGRTALLLDAAAPRLEKCAGAEKVEITRREPNRTAISASLGCRGLVVLSDNYFPGWKALLDGREVPIVEVYGTFRGVVVGAGRHTVEMLYSPLCVRLGILLSVAGLLACGALMVLPGKRLIAPPPSGTGERGRPV